MEQDLERLVKLGAITLIMIKDLAIRERVRVLVEGA